MSTRAASTRSPPRHDDYRPEPDRWKALAVCLAAGFMTLLDVSIVNVALPSIEQGLHAQPNELEWIVSAHTAAVPALARNLALEIAPIRVNVSAAGFVDTPCRPNCSATSSTRIASIFVQPCRSGVSLPRPTSPRWRST